MSAGEHELAGRLRAHVEALAAFGPRNVPRYGALSGAAEYLDAAFRRAGCDVSRQEYLAAGRSVANLEAELRGTRKPDRVVVVGAHYDSVGNSPGANDNGSGVAALLELAARFANAPLAATVRFVAFVNEEPPWFMTDEMGSVVYARRSRERNENVVAMLSLETIGYYSDEPGSQQYPWPFHLFFPSTGDFLAMVSNVRSAGLLRRVASGFKSGTTLRVIASPAPERIPGIGWSDHWSFWKQGYAAVMLTDTAPYRYPYYHTTEDTPEKLDYERLARVVPGVASALHAIAR